ncbi:carbohydrate kinase family protein [Planctomicrobium sp. SH664]|uniref:carbohydrate kinase family protein n=1 Tax=Planctomicrobium sp. SH664 TaxID=3448125 RepID=UPI003F5C6203
MVPPPIVVAGHICLDVIPEFAPGGSSQAAAFRPGDLIHVGPALTATGGAVANTGVALHRLGVPVHLIARIGQDLFGDEILRLLNAQSPTLSQGLVRLAGETTSYTIVLSPPGVDRTFLHCPGSNNTFGPEDVEVTDIRQSNLFHFGYPPLMRRMHQEEGRLLEELFLKVRAAGLTVSLDLCVVDPQSEAGRCDWRRLLERVLPSVDLFCPSVDELLFMLDRPRYEQMLQQSGGRFLHHVDPDLLRQLSDDCLRLGAAVVLLKLGDAGLYLRTSADRHRFDSMGRATPRDREAWLNRELHTPCFEVDVVGTTGSGDCTIAGFLAALQRGESPEQAIVSAVAVGAASVEAADANSGVPAWNVLSDRIQRNWPMKPSRLQKLPSTPVATSPGS